MLSLPLAVDNHSMDPFRPAIEDVGASFFFRERGRRRRNKTPNPRLALEWRDTFLLWKLNAATPPLLFSNQWSFFFLQTCIYIIYLALPRGPMTAPPFRTPESFFCVLYYFFCPRWAGFYRFGFRLAFRPFDAVARWGNTFILNDFDPVVCSDLDDLTRVAREVKRNGYGRTNKRIV